MKDASQQLIQDRIRELREKTDFVSTLFERLIGYAIIAADFDGNIIAYNEGARLVYGYAPEEVIGKQAIEIFFPEEFIEAGRLQQVIDALIAEDGFGYEGEKVRKNGEVFPAQVQFTLTRDNTGGMVGFVEIVEDLTERKRAEAERAEAQAEAERAAAERMEQQERELRRLRQLSASPPTAVTAQLLGIAPLHEYSRDAFDQLVKHYGDLMDLALEQRAFKVEHNISEGLRSMAEQMGFLKAGPRDVVEIYSSALKAKTNGATAQKAQAYAEEGRLMALELMGYLVSHYRNYSLGSGRVTVSAASKAEGHGKTNKGKGYE